MIKFFKKIIQNIKLYFLDKKNYKQFINDIENEMKDPRSYFSQYQLILNEDKNKITCLFAIPENFAIQNDDRLINMKIQELIQPITQYLSYTLGWAEYLYVPQVYHIEDDNISSGTSLTYIAIWQWAQHTSKYYLYKVIGTIIGIIGILTAIILFLV